MQVSNTTFNAISNTKEDLKRSFLSSFVKAKKKKKKLLQTVTLTVPFSPKMFTAQNDNNYIFKNIIKGVENSNTIDKV